MLFDKYCLVLAGFLHQYGLFRPVPGMHVHRGLLHTKNASFPYGGACTAPADLTERVNECYAGNFTT